MPPGGNDSTMRIENRAQHRFWETLLQNIRDILRSAGQPAASAGDAATTPPPPRPDAAPTREGSRRPPADGIAPPPLPQARMPAARSAPDSRDEAAAVIAHPETGILAVRATARQHERVREFLDRVLDSARRQVMIEATLVEVQLSNAYQQGIDWSRIAGSAGFGASLSGPVAAAPGLFALNYRNDSFAGMVRLLDTFGTTKVLSSPKLSVMNNQPAVLKVVDNSVYFTIKADTAQNQTTTVTTYTTTLNQVPVGFVMSVTPQISETDTVLLNVRPSVSRIIGTVRDPNPALRKSAANAFAEDIVSEIPVIRTREMESLLRVRDGDVAVMGGLMEDSLHNKDATVPGLGQLPFVGEAFTQRNDSATKSELVVFLRPTIIRDPSLAGDYAHLRDRLPGDDFFTAIPDPQAPGDKARPSWLQQ
jgi:general secretion pathway protein D